MTKSLTALLLLLLIVNACYGVHGDEADNLLGGVVLAQGGSLYVDYWSHHMPLPYVLAGALGLVVQTFLAFRLAFALVLFGYWLALKRILQSTAFGSRVMPLAVLVVLASPMIHAQMLMAETLVGYFAIAALLVLVYRIIPGERSTGLALLVGLLALAMVFASLMAVYLAGTILVMLVLLYRNQRRAGATASLILMGGVAALILVLPRGPMTAQVYHYNADTYAPYFGNPDTGWKVSAGFFHYFEAIVRGSFEQPLAIVFVAVTWFLVAISVYRRRYALALLVVLVTVLSFYPLYGGFRGKVHLTDHYLIGLAIVAIAAHQVHRLRVAQYIVVGLVIPGTIASLIALGSVLTTASSPPFTNTKGEDFLAAFLQPDETVWIGPMDFHRALRFADYRASRHSYLAPWTAADPTTTAQLLTDLQTGQPIVLAIETDWRGYRIADYAPTLMNWISDHYFQAPGYPGLWFAQDREQLIVARLGQMVATNPEGN